MIIKYYEILSGAVAAGILLLSVFILHISLWISLFITFAIFAGLFMIGSFWTELQIERDAHRMTKEKMADKISEGKKKLLEIRKIAENINHAEIKNQISRICDLGTRIFKNFDENLSAFSGASRFLLYIDRILPYMEKYARVSSSQTGREMLGSDSEITEILNSLEQGFEQGFKNYLEKDVIELKTVGRVLNKMMNIAEIGK